MSSGLGGDFGSLGGASVVAVLLLLVPALVAGGGGMEGSEGGVKVQENPALFLLCVYTYAHFLLCLSWGRGGGCDGVWTGAAAPQSRSSQLP